MAKIKLYQWLMGMCALALLVLSYLSYEYLAFKMFRIGLNRFYNIVPTVPEQCGDAVGYAAAAFAGVYDYVAWALAAVLLVLGLFFAWRAYSTRSAQ